MQTVWDDAIETALAEGVFLRASELQVNMIVRRVKGDRNHRVMEVLIGPDGFSKMGIVNTLDDHGYTQTWLHERLGKGDDPIWMILGWHVTPDS